MIFFASWKQVFTCINQCKKEIVKYLILFPCCQCLFFKQTWLWTFWNGATRPRGGQWAKGRHVKLWEYVGVVWGIQQWPPGACQGGLDLIQVRNRPSISQLKSEGGKVEFTNAKAVFFSPLIQFCQNDLINCLFDFKQFINVEAFNIFKGKENYVVLIHKQYEVVFWKCLLKI